MAALDLRPAVHAAAVLDLCPAVHAVAALDVRSAASAVAAALELRLAVHAAALDVRLAVHAVAALDGRSAVHAAVLHQCLAALPDFVANAVVHQHYGAPVAVARPYSVADLMVVL